MSAFIEAEGLTKYYGDVRGVEDLTFTVEEGEIFGFLGPNGAGKTTAIRTMLGFLKPTDGEARLLGYDAFDRSELVEAKKEIGHLPGDPTFYDGLTGEEVLDYYASIKGDERRDELAEMFDFPRDRKVGEYSRGNRQKLAIVQAFMHDPRLVVMDEPTSGLDPLMQNTLYDFLRDESDEGVSIFFSSHILSEVRKICDRVGIIRDGRLVTLEEIDELLEKSGKVVRVKTRDDAGVEDFDVEGVSNASIDDEGYVTLVLGGGTDYDDFVDRLDEHPIDDVEIRKASLEDIFMHFYDGDGFDGEEVGAGAGAGAEAE